MKSYFFKTILLALFVFTLSVGCEKAAPLQNQRLTEDIARWEAELAKVTEKAKSDRENAAHHNAEAELIRSRIARLKIKLTSPH